MYSRVLLAQYMRRDYGVELNSIRQLRTFVAVARAGSFSAAGRQLNISQPAVSKQMQELEGEIGAKLFERGRRLVMTEVGQALFQDVEHLLLAAEHVEAVLESRTTLRGHLEIGASTVWEYLLPRLAADFQKQHAEVYIGLRIANSEQIVRLVARKEVRMGFVGAPPGSLEVEATPAGQDELLFIAPKGHPLALRAATHPAALLGQPFVLRERDSATAQIGLRHLRLLGIEPRVVMELGSNEALKIAVRCGAGIGLISRHAIEDELRMGALAQLHVEGPPCLQPLYTLRNPTRPPTPLEAAFLQAVVPHSATHP